MGVISPASCLTIAQGDGESERIGRKICVKSIGWKFRVSLPTRVGAGSGLADTIRVIVYLDQQTNGVAAGVTEILESADFQSFNNLANKGRFKTLMDRTYNLTNPSGAGDGAVNDFSELHISDSFYKKCSIPIEYDNSAGTGAITTMRSNNIGVLMISGGTALATFNSKMRIRYTD